MTGELRQLKKQLERRPTPVSPLRVLLINAHLIQEDQAPIPSVKGAHMMPREPELAVIHVSQSWLYISG